MMVLGKFLDGRTGLGMLDADAVVSVCSGEDVSEVDRSQVVTSEGNRQT